ncbi:MAG: Flp family type IVb pilin [Proteobacteria bacterium]|nr:Flp family type IVb pilin [Pseudomonadota bacterium]
MSRLARHGRRARALIACFAKARRGATAIEYALIAAAIGATLAATIWGLGSDLRTNFYDKLAALL